MGKVITVSINKGGAGKTTVSTNIAHLLSNLDKKVCLLDLDGQCGCTILYGYSANYFNNKSVLSIINENRNLNEIIFEVSNNLYLIPSEPNMRYYDAILGENKNLNSNLNKLIKHLKTKFDYVIIDTQAILSASNKVAMSNSDIVIIPFEPERQNVEGVLCTLNELSDQRYDQSIIKCIIPTKFRKRACLDRNIINYVKSEIIKFENTKLLENYIPFSSQYKNIPAKNNIPLIASSSNAKYILLQKEIINNIVDEIINE